MIHVRMHAYFHSTVIQLAYPANSLIIAMVRAGVQSGHALRGFSSSYFFNVCRSLRLAAYRQYTWWIHGYLGRGDRRVIPSCVVSAVRREFPEPQDNYTGFQEANEDGEEPFWPG